MQIRSFMTDMILFELEQIFLHIEEFFVKDDTSEKEGKHNVG